MMWNHLNAWREILARVFEGFSERRDVTPDWLVNPDTNRRLKLDVVYPDIGVAIRYSGLQVGNKSRRLSLDEESKQRVRDTARARVCLEHGILLVQIDVTAGEPLPTMHELRMALGDASRRLAQSHRPHHQKTRLMEQLSQARSRMDDIVRRVRGAEDLRLFADLWQDRQYAAGAPPSDETASAVASVEYAAGMAVRHTTFGEGYVVAVQREPAGQLITVCFRDGALRKFAAHLVCDKMSPLPSL
jgi:hypothetical protein